MRTFKNRFQDTQNTNYPRQGPTQNLNQRPILGQPVGWPQSGITRPIQYQGPNQNLNQPLISPMQYPPVGRPNGPPVQYHGPPVQYLNQYQGQQQQPIQPGPSHHGQQPSNPQVQHFVQRPPLRSSGPQSGPPVGLPQSGQRRRAKELSEIDVQRNNKLNEHLEEQLKKSIYTIPYNPSFGTNFIGYIQPSSKEEAASLVVKKSEKLQHIDKESKFFNVINENKGGLGEAGGSLSEAIMSENLFKNFRFDKVFFEKYMKQNDASVYYTFRYLFYKFKKSIYIKIVNNEIDMFIPFTNINFVNEWHSLINIRNTFPKNRKEKNESILNFLSEVNNVTNRIAGTKYFIDRRKIKLP